MAKRAVVTKTIFPVLFYGLENWSLNARDLGRLRAVLNDCRRAILGATRYDHLKREDLESKIFKTAMQLQKRIANSKSGQE